MAHKAIERLPSVLAENGLIREERERETLTLLNREHFQLIFTQVIFGRHGSTLYNEERRVQGSVDTTLSDRGRSEVLQRVKLIKNTKNKVALVVSSNTARARETGMMLAAELGVTFQVKADLHELNHGEWEGMYVTDIISNPINEAWTFGRMRNEPNDIPPHNGESTINFLKRINDVLHELYQLIINSQYSDKKIIHISHGEVIRAIRFLYLLLDTYGTNVNRSQIEELMPAYFVVEGKILRIPHALFVFNPDTTNLDAIT